MGSQVAGYINWSTIFDKLDYLQVLSAPAVVQLLPAHMQTQTPLVRLKYGARLSMEWCNYAGLARSKLTSADIDALLQQPCACTQDPFFHPLVTALVVMWCHVMPQHHRAL